MNLPNYFIADLPGHAELTPDLVREGCNSLRRNREKFLLSRSTNRLVDFLDHLGRQWRDPRYPLRRMALDSSPQETRFTAPILEKGLDHFFENLTRESLEELLIQDLGHSNRLDYPVSAGGDEEKASRGMAIGPELLLHIAPGNLPIPILMQMILGVLTKSAQWIKCATGTSLIPRLFAHSIYQQEPKIGACLEIAEWPGGSHDIEQILFAQADCITATGSDATLRDIRSRLPGHARCLGYGHRISFGFIAKENLCGPALHEAVLNAAEDVTAWNQLGCLSPHVLFVQKEGIATPESFAELLARELEKREETHPRGPLPAEEAAAITTRRSFYEIRAAHRNDVQCWWSKESTAWTVIYETADKFQTSCLNRFVYVQPVEDVDHVLKLADPFRHQLSTVGLAAPKDRTLAFAQQFARWGAPRVCPLGRMQRPRLAWRHDGRPALGDLVRWTDVE